MQSSPRLTTAQAAARLGVKPSTLYAYVSRGLVTSVRGDDGGSTFDALEIEELSGSRRRDAAPAAPSGRPLMVIDSDLTLLRDDRLFFRGVPAEELVQRAGFEQAAEMLWGASGTAPFAAPASLRARVRRATAPLGDARPVTRLQAGVLVAGADDPFRDDLSPDQVHAAGRRIAAAMVEAIGAPHGDDRAAEPGADRRIAAGAWRRLADREPEPGDLDLVDAALVLGMDHDLAVSTLAARAAASARAHPYAAVGAALAAFDSALHGAASAAAEHLLREAMAGDAAESISHALAARHGIPGFGHAVYRRRDPRAELLLARMARLPAYRAPLRAAERLAAVVASRLDRPANVDLALAVLAVGAGFPPGGAQALFALARSAGWIAHAADEYRQAPLRLRAESRYVGPT